MERQTYTNTNRYLFLFLIALMVSCSKSDVQIAKSLNKEIAIYPDYKDVTIPVNIAPLNFSIADSSEHCLIIKGEKTQLQAIDLVLSLFPFNDKAVLTAIGAIEI